MYRLTKNENSYIQYRKGEKGCYFCKPEPKVVILKTNNFYLSKNNFPYDFWDGQRVKKHFLIVSKKHLPNMSTKDLLLEYGQLINKYYKLGYDLFVRTQSSPSKSQPHFHSHLIQTEGKKIKKLYFNANPYKLSVE